MSNKHPSPATRAPAKPLPAERERTTAPAPIEKDSGFNESHGYGPAHGGPSGPGDSPSKEPATVVPVDPEEPGDVDE